MDNTRVSFLDDLIKTFVTMPHQGQSDQSPEIKTRDLIKTE
jgi:hypothetical protein